MIKRSIFAVLTAIIMIFGIACTANAGDSTPTPAGAARKFKPPGTQTVIGPFTVYLDPSGSNSNDGLTPATAVYSLERAEAIVAATNPTTNVEIRIAPGTYETTAQTKWTTYVAGKTITFIPTGWNPGEPTPTRPVFENSNGHTGYWFRAELPAGHPGGNTNLKFYYLEATGYAAGGLAIVGDIATNPNNNVRYPDGAGMNNNYIYGLKIHHVGNAHNASGTGYGGFVLWNSSGNTIRNNHVQYAENSDVVDSNTKNLIHAIYLAHGSSNNEIDGNAFKFVSGHPMNVRNGSSFNDIHDNSFTRTGHSGAAYYSEWFCDQDCVDYHDGHPRECASDQNAFHHNELISGYDSATSWIPAFVLNPPGSYYAGGSGCAITGPRLSTYGNVRP